MRAAQSVLGRVGGVVQLQSELRGVVYRVDWSRLAPWQVLKLQDLMRTARTGLEAMEFGAHFGGHGIDCGVLSRRYVTDTGVGYIVDAFQNSVEMETMKYHGLGTSSTAENQSQTGPITEITTTHYTGSVRPTGSTEEGASANIYKTIGTHTHLTAGDTVTEHCVMSSATPAAGVCLDRSVFTGVALAVADSFVTTYQLTLSAGG